jgi:hypothetical protein
MSALRVVIFFENAELNLVELPWTDVLYIIHGCNYLWKHHETEEIKYRTLPEDDGELYVIPGVFDECRCSHSEVMLEDPYPYDLDNHHFRYTTLPKDIHEKTMVYSETGDLFIKKLVGGLHPLYDPQSPDTLNGIFARFEIVNWDEPETADSVS